MMHMGHAHAHAGAREHTRGGVQTILTAERSDAQPPNPTAQPLTHAPQPTPSLLTPNPDLSIPVLVALGLASYQVIPFPF